MTDFTKRALLATLIVLTAIASGYMQITMHEYQFEVSLACLGMAGVTAMIVVVTL